MDKQDSTIEEIKRELQCALESVRVAAKVNVALREEICRLREADSVDEAEYHRMQEVNAALAIKTGQQQHEIDRLRRSLELLRKHQ